jgi:8-oxo-dGTP pyrophosphatase MutT (NUDIX family)
MTMDKRGYRKQVRIIIVKNDMILLGEKYKNSKFNNYSFPGGGVDEGDTPEETVIKECLEEVGIEVDSVLSLGITMRYEHLTNPERAKIYRGGEDTWYICKFKNFDSKLLGSQGDSFVYSWETVDKAIELIHQAPKFQFNKVHLSVLNSIRSHSYLNKMSKNSFTNW